MGKSNRIRNNRANDAFATPKSAKKKQGMPSWAINLITILVAAVILLSATFLFLNANGVFARMQTALKSDNFRVDANMMKYYYQTQYSSIYSQYSSSIDSSKSLKDQACSISTTGETWYEYIMSQTTAQVKELLVYCEEAEAIGMELDDAAKSDIDAELKALDTYATSQGYTTDSYIVMMYGKGVKKSDIRNALELRELATLCATSIGEEIKEGIKPEDITAKYDADKRAYNVVDMISYSMTVTYAEAKKECVSEADEATVIAKYKEMIAEAKAKAEALKATADKEAFEALLAEYIVDKYYDADLKEAEGDTEVAVAKDKEPTAEGWQSIIKSTIVAQIRALILEDKDFSKDDIAKDSTVGTVTGISDEYVAFLKTVAENVYTDAKGVYDNTNKENSRYNENNDMSKWAFEDGRADGDKNIVESGDKEIAEDAAASSLNSYTVETAFIVKKAEKDETLTKNVAVAVFATEEKANAALAKMSAGMTLDTFKAAAEENDAGYSAYENYTKGSLDVAELDEWLYADTTVVGSYTTGAISVINTSSTGSTSTTYMLIMYHADGEAEWSVSVESVIFSERSTAKAAELTEKYTIEVKDKVINKIG